MKEKKLKKVFCEDVKSYPNICDLFEDDEIDNEVKCFKKYKKLEPFTYLTKKQMEDLQEVCSVRIIGNVRLRDKFKNKNTEEIQDRKKKKNSKIIGCCNFKYSDEYRRKHPMNDNNCESEAYLYEQLNLYKPNNTSCIGYAYVGGDRFVRIEKENYFVIILIIMLLIAGIVVGFTVMPTDSNKGIFDNNDDYHSDNSFDADYETNVQLDFVSYYRLTKKNPCIELPNAEKNRYALSYDIYLIKPNDIDKKDKLSSTYYHDKNQDGKYTEGEEAGINPNDYSDDEIDTVLYLDVNSNGKKDKGETLVDKKIYESDLIKPGKNPGADLWKILDAGQYYVALDIHLANLDGTPLEGSGKYKVTTGFQTVTTVIDVVK